MHTGFPMVFSLLKEESEKRRKLTFCMHAGTKEEIDRLVWDRVFCHVLKGWVITARGRSRTQAKITLGRSPGEGNGNPLQYSCLENPMDGGAW